MTTRDQPCIAVEFMAVQKRNGFGREKSSNVIAFYVYVFVMLITTGFIFERVRKN